MGRDFSPEKEDALHTSMHAWDDSNYESPPRSVCRRCGNLWPCIWDQRRREVEWLRLQRNAWRPVIEAARKVVDSKGWAVMQMEAMDELQNLLWELGDWEEYHQDQGKDVS